MANTVLIVDDHPLFRRGVAQLLEMDPEIVVAGEASGLADALDLARRTDPDLILLDLNLSGANGRSGGLEVLTALKDEDASLRVVMLTVSDAPDDLVNALRRGADGYLLKDSEPEEILARVRDALSGRTVLTETLAGRLAMAMRQDALQTAANPRDMRRNLADLTERERAVLRGVADGLSNKLIAQTLSITEGTVKVHVKHVLKKLGFRSRVEAAVWATEIGLRNAA